MLLASLATAQPADAAATYQYSLKVRTAAFTGSTASATIEVSGINSAQNSRLRWLRGGIEQAVPVNTGTGATVLSASVAAIQPGDQIEIQQPLGSVKETWTVPPFGPLSFVVGGTSVAGTMAPGSTGAAYFEGGCFFNDEDSNSFAPAADGTFSAQFPAVIAPGTEVAVFHYPGQGDVVAQYDRAAGETPCVEVEAEDPFPYIGSTPDPDPYQIDFDHLNKTVAPSARIVLRRSGTPLVDYSDPSVSTGVYTDHAVKPQPGDVVELYRPAGAPSPSQTYVVPAVTARHDTRNQLVAVDGPASKLIEVYVQPPYVMWSTSRFAAGRPAGRSIFNFAVPEQGLPVADLARSAAPVVKFVDTSGLIRYEFNSVAGDLVAPALTASAPKKLSLAKLAKGLSLKLVSDEAVQTKIVVTVPGKRKPTTLISGKQSLVAGSKTFKLKLTSSGKKLVKKLRRQGRKFKGVKATLTVTALDAAGNQSVATKSIKLVAK